MSKFLVIGSNSFSGQSFIKYILQKKDVKKVFCVSRSSNKKFSPEEFNIFSKKVFFTKININNEKSSKLIKRLIIKNEINYIINYASQSMVGESWIYPIDWYRTNVIGTISLVEGLRGVNCIKKFIHFTTPEVYGSQNKFQKESFSFNPSTPYAISRACSDYHLKLLHKEFNFPVIFTRASNVYGEFQDFYRLIPKAFIFAKNKMIFPLQGSGISKRNFIHIDDVSEAIYQIFKKGKIGETYHISSKNMHSIKNIVEKIYKLYDLNPKNYLDIKEERVGKDLFYKLDSSKLRKNIKWSQKISLEDGLIRYKSWFQKIKLKNLKINYIHKK